MPSSRSSTTSPPSSAFASPSTALTAAADPLPDPRRASPRLSVAPHSPNQPAAAGPVAGLADAPALPSGDISSTTASSSRAGGSAGDDIEMEPIKGQQHRRRKSSLMNPVGHSPLPSPSRPMGHPSSLLEVIDSPYDGTGSGTRETALGRDVLGRNSFSDDEDLQDDEEMGLTTTDRARKQKKRSRNTRLDQRIAREKHVSTVDRKSADRDVVRQLAINGGLILLWYMFSLSISLYNKWMFDAKRLNFPFPLFTTSLHMLIQFGLSALVLYFVPSLRPYAHNSDMGRSRHETEPASAGMSHMFYLSRIGPCGVATGLDIGLGNTSLKVISLTFYTMCKSSSLAFVLLFAFAFRLETPTWRLVAIIGTMTLGVVLMVFGEVEFKLGGFVLVISAAFFSGFRWGLTQILLLRNPATSNPFSSIFYLSPVMFLTLLFIALPVEGFGSFVGGLKALSAEWGTVTTPFFLLFPGCIAFCMTAAEFALLQRTSVVTLSIAGIFKEVVTISAASIVFGDKLTFINLIGLLTTLAAIIAYNYVKISKMREEAQGETIQVLHDATSPSNSASDVENDDSVEETAGLLHQSVDMSQSLVTSDGDIQPNLLPDNPTAVDHREHHKPGGHED